MCKATPIAQADEVKSTHWVFRKLLAPVDPEFSLASSPQMVARHRLKRNHSRQRCQATRQYPEADDDERLLRFMFAGPQVDEMRAAGAMKTEYLFEAPLVRLVQELASRKVSRAHFSMPQRK